MHSFEAPHGHGRGTYTIETNGGFIIYTQVREPLGPGRRQESSDLHNYEIWKTCETTVLNQLTLLRNAPRSTMFNKFRHCIKRSPRILRMKVVGLYHIPLRLVLF